MTATTPAKARPEIRPQGPLLLAWSRAAAGVDLSWLENVRGRLDGPAYVLGETVGKARSVGRGPSDLRSALERLARLHPDRSVLILRSGLEPPAPLAALLDWSAASLAPDQIVFPSSHETRLNPFVDWPAGIALPEDPALLVNWCGDRHWQKVEHAALDCLLVSADMACHRAALVGRGPAALVDDCLVLESDTALCAERSGERVEAGLLGTLRLRLRRLAQSGGLDSIPAVAVASGSDAVAPVTLHICHGWGGGVWRWIDDFISGDESGINLVLLAESDRSGKICGRSLQLCVAGVGRGVIREFPLSPEIASTQSSHSGYRHILEQLIERFGIGRLLVSSLIGHSLDCLRTGLPTAQILHDFYPLWPLLDFDPLPYVREGQGLELRRALQQHGASMRMGPLEPAFWSGLADAWRRCVRQHQPQLIAPTDHVIERWRALCPRTPLEIRKVAHGFRPFEREVEAFEPNESGPLHLLIPGRLTLGKGLALMREILPRLRDSVRFTALGCGREAFDLFGQAGIDLIPDYKREDFPALVAQLRPHAALLISTVPETWSYTLSEVRAVGLVPIATRIGSFRERITDETDGLLVAPEADAIVAAIRSLDQRRGRLREMAGRARPEWSVRSSAARINRLVPVERRLPGNAASMSAEELIASRTAGLLGASESYTEELQEALRRLEIELERRTAWAHKLERQFRERSLWIESLERERARLEGLWSRDHKRLEQSLEKARADFASTRRELQQREHWAKSLDKQLQRIRLDYTELQQQLEERTQWARSLDRELDKVRSDHAALQDQLEERSQWARSLDRELAKQRRQHVRLQQQLDERTRWANELDAELLRLRELHQQLQREFEHRTDWALALQQENKELKQVLNQEIDRWRELAESEQQARAEADERVREIRAVLDERDEQLKQRDEALDRAEADRTARAAEAERLSAQLQATQELVDRITASASWRLTRPFRVIQRVFSRDRLMRLSNPLNWWTMMMVLARHWHRRGLKDMLVALQSSRLAEQGPAPVESVAEPKPKHLQAAVRFPLADVPVVSVVVPVYNQLHHTAACLRSMLAARTEVEFEVIVGDDASSDDTHDWLKGWTQLSKPSPPSRMLESSVPVWCLATAAFRKPAELCFPTPAAGITVVAMTRSVRNTISCAKSITFQGPVLPLKKAGLRPWVASTSITRPPITKIPIFVSAFASRV
ncbi:MAG: glycosyltransferase [Xanthomonadaceae bacterium]|nr:glycosyltransferase [Xanthomonadaceae bacterium]